MVVIISYIALFISVISLIFSIKSFLYIEKQKKKENRPYFRLEKVMFDTEKLRIYTSATDLNVKESSGVYPLDDELLRIIDSTRNSVSLTQIKGKYYYLINLLKEDSDKSKVSLYLDVLEVTWANNGSRVNNITILGGVSKLRDEDVPLILDSKDVKFDLIEKDGTITFSVAYVCREGQKASLQYHRINELKNSKVNADLKTNFELANEIINFKENRNHWRCECTKYEYEFDILLYMNENEFNGRMEFTKE